MQCLHAGHLHPRQLFFQAYELSPFIHSIPLQTQTFHIAHHSSHGRRNNNRQFHHQNAPIQPIRPHQDPLLRAGRHGQVTCPALSTHQSDLRPAMASASPSPTSLPLKPDSSVAYTVNEPESPSTTRSTNQHQTRSLSISRKRRLRQ